jgi:hypothetical protein
MERLIFPGLRHSVTAAFFCVSFAASAVHDDLARRLRAVNEVDYRTSWLAPAPLH